MSRWVSPAAPLFQSTLSVRRATHDLQLPHSMTKISIHALRKESDVYDSSGVLRKSLFQSTLSVRRATRPIWRQR